MTEDKTNAQAASAAAQPVAKAVSVPMVKKTATRPAGKPAASVSAGAPPAAKAPVRKRSLVDETVERQQKELAAALEQAQAITYDKRTHIQPAVKPGKSGKPANVEKPVKAKKPKLVRDSFAMPAGEYALIGELKARLAGEYRKSEVLRAGVMALAALNESELKAVMGHVERIKTGRPSKK